LKSIDGMIKIILEKVGLEIHRISPSKATRQIVSSLRKYEIDLVLDVGANEGQFAKEIRKAGYAGKIISFEPLSKAHAELLQASGKDSNWHIHPRCALGDYNGKIEINIAGNSVSSSILPMLESHRIAAPESAYEGKEMVALHTLDTIAGQYLSIANAPFLKIDTQGFEWNILKGATQTLPIFKGVLLELSLVPLYDGQHLWREMLDWLEAKGFILWSLQPGFTDLTVGRTLQFDGIFFRI